jgi:hypothetical protein
MDEILAIGVSEILVSVDSIDPDQCARIRRGSSSRGPDQPSTYTESVLVTRIGSDEPTCIEDVERALNSN